MKIEDVFKKLKPLANQDMDLLWQGCVGFSV